jgi:hypothetical protein
MLKHLLTALPLIAATSLIAAEAPPAMSAYVDSDILTWVNDAQIVDAIIAQNTAHSALTQADIDARDKDWRAQVGTANRPLVDAVLSAPVAEFLKQQVAASGGRITEVFIMDNHGLNVAASAVTSDYWQGDEAKFKNTYPKGAGTVFIDQVDFDESTQTYQGQVSVAVTDPASGNVIGAITIGLDASAFF